MRTLGLVVLLSLLAPSIAHAQTTDDGATAEQAVRDAIASLFTAMRTNDSTGVRAVMHPRARLLTVATRDGQNRLSETQINDFVRAVGTSSVPFDERVTDVAVQIDGGLASAWMSYRFYAGTRFSHCGTNALHLTRDDAGWRLVHIMDTRRSDCE